MEKYFVEFLCPGVFVAETSMVEIDTIDTKRAVEMAKKIIQRYGSRPYGFRFITRGRAENDLDSKIVAQSGIYYLNGIVETLEQIKERNDPENEILISNMENNGWERVVTTYSPYRWTQPFEKCDEVIMI